MALPKPESACLVIADISGNISRAPPFVSTYELIDLPDGRTRLATHMQKPPSGQEAGFDVVRAVLEEYYDQSKVNLIKLVETAARKESEAEIVQPSLPTSRGRFLTEPVTAQA